MSEMNERRDIKKRNFFKLLIIILIAIILNILDYFSRLSWGVVQQRIPDDTPEPLPTPNPTDINNILWVAIKKLEPGLMAFNPPKWMKQAKVERVELRIVPIGQAGQTPSVLTQTAIADTLTAELEGSGEASVEPISVGTVMKARLMGDSFDISPLSEEEQFVSDDTYTEWVWNVKPLNPGERELYLTVTVKVIVESLGERARDISVITRKVFVEVDPVYTTTTFLGNNWKWLFGALLLPIFGWGWQVYSKKRAEKKKKI